MRKLCKRVYAVFLVKKKHFRVILCTKLKRKLTNAFCTCLAFTFRGKKPNKGSFADGSAIEAAMGCLGGMLWWIDDSDLHSKLKMSPSITNAHSHIAFPRQITIYPTQHRQRTISHFTTQAQERRSQNNNIIQVVRYVSCILYRFRNSSVLNNATVRELRASHDSIAHTRMMYPHSTPGGIRLTDLAARQLVSLLVVPFWISSYMIV